MERVGAFIHKLEQQFQQNATAEQLSVTVQLLLAELQQQSSIQYGSNTKVSVIMPLVYQATQVAGREEAAQIIETPVQQTNKTSADITGEQPPVIHWPEIPVQNSIPPRQDNAWHADPLLEIPTLAHQNKELFELNEVMVDTSESLNESLRADKKELGAVLHDAPIRDLKKAIGINDRYLFINELFRGDETMYERSIKTINSFNILPEAEYWIQRELKLKIGWPEDSEAVQQFDQLIRRRFS